MCMDQSLLEMILWLLVEFHLIEGLNTDITVTLICFDDSALWKRKFGTLVPKTAWWLTRLYHLVNLQQELVYMSLMLVFARNNFYFNHLINLSCQSKSYRNVSIIGSIFERSNSSHGFCFPIAAMTLTFIIHLPSPSSIISLLIEITVHFFDRVFALKFEFSTQKPKIIII